MKPVDQEFIHLPGIGQHGDCQRAVIASLLELPIADVPHFGQLHAEGKGDFWGLLLEFLASRGFNYVQMAKPKFVWHGAPVFHEIGGPSPRGNGVFHVVVGCNGEVFFDPHPSRAGLAGDPDKWTHGFMVPL